MKVKEKPLFLDSITGEITDEPQEPLLINGRHLDKTIRDLFDVMGWDHEAPHLSARDMATIIEEEPRYSFGAGAVHINYDEAIRKAYKQIVKETRESNRNRCPFCGSEDTRLIKGVLSSYWIVCINCGGTGPAAPTEKEARKAWRKRIWQKKKH